MAGGYGGLLLSGAFVTISLALCTLPLGVLIGLLGATAKRSRLRPLAEIYTTVIRGVPEILTVLLIYYGLETLLAGRIEISPFLAGVIALGVTFGGYATEVFRGAMEAVPKGQIEATGGKIDKPIIQAQIDV